MPSFRWVTMETLDNGLALISECERLHFVGVENDDYATDYIECPSYSFYPLDGNDELLFHSFLSRIQNKN